MAIAGTPAQLEYRVGANKRVSSSADASPRAGERNEVRLTGESCAVSSSDKCAWVAFIDAQRGE